METTNEHHGGSDDFVDPLSHLALLSRSARAPEYETFLNFGPWWHAPIWATFFCALTLWARAGDEVSGIVSTAFLTLSFLSGAVLTHHWYHKRKVQLRLLPTALGLALSALSLVIIWVLSAAWSVPINIIGYQDFLWPWAPIGWALTTAFFLGMRTFFTRIRDSRRVAAV